MEAKGTDKETQHDHQSHEAHHAHRVRADLFIGLPHFLRRHPIELSLGCGEEILNHPAPYRGVEHHQQIVSDHGHIAMNIPFAPLGGQRMIDANRALSAGTAQGKFNGHNGDSHDQQEKQIEQDKRAASILSYHVRKLPDISDPDGTAGTEQNKAQTTA